MKQWVEGEIGPCLQITTVRTPSNRVVKAIDMGCHPVLIAAVRTQLKRIQADARGGLLRQSVHELVHKAFAHESPHAGDEILRKRHILRFYVCKSNFFFVILQLYRRGKRLTDRKLINNGNMKKVFLALTLALILCSATSFATSPKVHRSHYLSMNAAQATDTGAVEAYSDTTDAVLGAQEDSAKAQQPVVMYEEEDDDDDDDFMGFLSALSSHVGGVFAGLVVVLIIGTIFLGPLIVILLFIRYLFKRHNDKVRLAEAALKNGNPLPKEIVRPNYTGDFMWRKGVQNVCLGIGLALLFLFMGAEELAGIGALVACYGLGQVIMGRDARKKELNNDSLDADDSNQTATSEQREEAVYHNPYREQQPQPEKPNADETPEDRAQKPDNGAQPE